MNKWCIVFDIDDTLYKEIDFVRSGYRFISSIISRQHGLSREEIYECLLNAYSSGENAFEKTNEMFNLTIPITKYLEWYRFHFPNIAPEKGIIELLEFVSAKGIETGIISDGRSITQRNKIKALGLDKYISDDNIVISEEFGSEKPCILNYKFFADKYPDTKRFIYVGDNISKDFITPNKIGWLTIGITDNGQNIYKTEPLPTDYQPLIWVPDILELKASVQTLIEE